MDGGITSQELNPLFASLILGSVKSTGTTEDSEGNPTVVSLFRPDDTLWYKSTASNPTASLKYQTYVVQEFDAAGTTVLKTSTYTVGWNVNDKIISVAVVQS
jgi:hypothetical protein